MAHLELTVRIVVLKDVAVSIGELLKAELPFLNSAVGLAPVGNVLHEVGVK